MGTARIFRSVNSQAVRLPKQCRLKSKEVEIFAEEMKSSCGRRSEPWFEHSICWLVCSTILKSFGREKDRPQKRKGL